MRREGKALRCETCNTAYDVRDDVPRLADGDEDAARITRPVPLLDELTESMKSLSADEAARQFCGRHRCRRVPHGADWKLLLPVAPGSSVLEIGPGFGDTTLDLAARARSVVALAAHAASGSLLRRHASQRGVEGVQVGVAARLDRLPLESGAFDAVASSEIALRGFGIEANGLGRLASELRRVSAPGASVLLGLANPLHRLPGAAALRSRLQAGNERTLDALLREALAWPDGRGWGLGRLERAMRGHGFEGPTLFAPIPDEERAKAVLPVRDIAVVRYFLANLVRRNAPLTRATLAAFDPLVRLGLFPRLVPYWFAIFRCPVAAGRRDDG